MLLIAAAILAGLVIRQGIINARTIRAQSRSTSTVKSNGRSAIAEQASVENVAEVQPADLNVVESDAAMLLLPAAAEQEKPRSKNNETIDLNSTLQFFVQIASCYSI